MRKTMVEIIEETAAFYNLGNRSVRSADDNYCLYNGPDGKQCAFSRMCIDPSVLKEGEPASRIINTYGQVILKEEYRGYSPAFYNCLQLLHDDPMSWTKTGISELGLKQKKLLIERWAPEQVNYETHIP